nr:hypothetical protein Iba_chr02eCG5450 [Ipomoea batatas]
MLNNRNLSRNPSRIWLSQSSCNIAMTLSLFVRRTCITFSQVERKFPSIPLTSIALTSILVRRKATFSGNFSRFIEASKQSPKSICSLKYLYRCNMRLLGCRSPKPSK